jgi:glycosyltransferase involved in cell wall biosynthesis
MEAAMIGCPLVASPVYPYIEKIQGLDTIVDKKTGLFAKTTQEWIDCLELLITNATLREEIATNAYNYIRDNWQYSSQAWRWKQVIDSHLNNLGKG